MPGVGVMYLFQSWMSFQNLQWLSVNKCSATYMPVQVEKFIDRNLYCDLGSESHFWICTRFLSWFSSVHLDILMLEIPLGASEDRRFTFHNKDAILSCHLNTKCLGSIFVGVFGIVSKLCWTGSCHYSTYHRYSDAIQLIPLFPRHSKASCLVHLVLKDLDLQFSNWLN